MPSRCGQLLWIVVSLFVTACEEAAPADAGMDAGVDAGIDAARDAASLMCEPECGVGDTCCFDDLGGTQCFALRNDPRHCGGCEVDCIASLRGTTCELGSCQCGSADLGCTGTDESTCCPPRNPGGLGWLGVWVQELTPDLALSFGSESTQGALVAGTESGSPAEKAGLQAGDIIRSVDGHLVKSRQALMNAIAGDQPGTEVELAFDREGSHMTATVVLGTRPASEEVSAFARIRRA